jgi:hypothetical protein
MAGAPNHGLGSVKKIRHRCYCQINIRQHCQAEFCNESDSTTPIDDDKTLLAPRTSFYRDLVIHQLL